MNATVKLNRVDLRFPFALQGGGGAVSAPPPRLLFSAEIPSPGGRRFCPPPGNEEEEEANQAASAATRAQRTQKPRESSRRAQSALSEPGCGHCVSHAGHRRCPDRWRQGRFEGMARCGATCWLSVLEDTREQEFFHGSGIKGERVKVRGSAALLDVKSDGRGAFPLLVRRPRDPAAGGRFA